MTKNKKKFVFAITENPYLTAVAGQVAAVITGFLLSFSGRGYTFAPLGVAAVCASGDKYRISVSIGSALGYILFCDSLGALRYIAAILCAFVLSKLLGTFDFTSSPLFMGLISAFCVFSTGTALMFAQSFTQRTLFITFTEAFCAFCISFIMKIMFAQLEIKPLPQSLSLREFLLCSFFVSLLLWTVSGFSFQVFSPASLTAFLLILILPELFSGLGSVLFGTVTCVVFSALSEGTVIPLSFVLGAIACTLAFFMSSALPLRAVYLLSATALAYLLGLPFENSFIFESIAAAVIFCAIPKRYIKKVTDYLSGSYEPIFGNEIKNGLSTRLRMASSAVEEVSSAVWAVCSGLDKGLPSVKSDVFSHVTGELCSKCSNYEYCWQEDREKTVSIFNALLERLKKNEYIDIQNMSIEAKNRCIKAFQLAQMMNGAFGNYTVESLCLQQKNEMRRCVAEHFCSVSDIIEDIAHVLEESSVPDENLSERVRVACFSFGIKPVRCICKYSANGRLKIEIECEKIPADFSEKALREKLELICSRQLETPVAVGGETNDYITVCEKYPLAVEVGSSQVSSNGEQLCGDSFEHFYDGRGGFDVVLADGMGTGARAALDGAMARGLTGTLLKKGISPVGTLRLVNSALMIKSPEESLASLDIMQVDMFSGKTEFYKAGAASSFVRHKGRIQEIKKPALPLGILHNVEFASMRGSIADGDIAVMVSDGIAECGPDRIRDVIKKNAALPSGEIAKKLTDIAVRTKGEKHDDLTAVVCKFH